MKFQAKKLKDFHLDRNLFQLKENFVQQLFSGMIFFISTFLTEAESIKEFVLLVMKC